MEFSFIPTVVAATPILDPNATYGTADMLRIAISLIVLVAMICAAFFIIYGGLMLVLSGGDDKKVSSALGSIRYAVIGLVVITLAIYLTPQITKMLGINATYDYLSPNSITETVQALLERVFGDSTGVLRGSSSSTTDFTDF